MNSHHSKSKGKTAGNVQLFQITLLEGLRDETMSSMGYFINRFSNSAAMKHNSSVIKQQRLTFVRFYTDGTENCIQL